MAQRGQFPYPRGLRKPAKPILDLAHPLSRGLVGCYLLGETSGLLDLSPTRANAVSVSTAPTVVPSHHGGTALHFDGTSQALSALFSPTLLSAFTVGCWVRTTGGAGTYRSFVAKATGGTRNYDLGARGGNVWGTYCTQAGIGVGVDGVVPIVLNAWTFVVTTYDGSTIRLFVDGLPDGSVSAPGGVDDAGAGLYIGSLSNSVGEFFPGDIEGVRIYNRALSQQEILAWRAEPYAGIYSVRQPFVGATAAGFSGAVAWTETQDTWAGSGAVAVAGSAAWTEIKDIWAGSGAVAISGSVAWTESKDIWAVSGSVITGVSGAVAWIEAVDVWAGSGAVAIAGSAAWTEAKDIWAVSGSISLPGITGSASWVEGPDLCAARGSNGLLWTPVPPAAGTWTPVLPNSGIWTPVS